MKTKITKILGIVLALSLMLALIPLPVTAATVPTTPNTWANVPVPSAVGNVLLAGVDCDFIAVGNDGTTMYAADNQVGAVYWSSNAGVTWTNITPVAATFPVIDMTVAPDDPKVVAFVDSADIDAVTGGVQVGDVYVTSDGGSVWAAMPRPSGLAAYTLDTHIQDLDISPALPWGREYAVCTGNNVGAVVGGNVFIYGTAGNPMGWADMAAPVEDYWAVTFTPGYAGYRVVLAVSADVADTKLNIKNTAIAGWNAVQGFVGWPVNIEGATDISPTEAEITAAGIAVPTDFDPSIATSRRAYVYWDANVVLNYDVYRVDDTAVRRLNVNAGVPIQLASIDYDGTLNQGSLYVGDSVTTQVRRTNDAFSAVPTWSPSNKPPSTGAVLVSGDTQVVLAPDFATSGIVYAGTSSGAANDESAFNVSRDNGVTFNQLSLIDSIIVAMMDVCPSPDGDVLFLATSDAVVAETDSLWRTNTSPLGTSWERVNNMVCAGGTAVVRVDPDYANTQAVYWAEAGAGAGTNIRFSTTAGQTWASRFSAAAITDLLVESKDVVYAAIGATVRKSTASGWTWGLPIGSQCGVITMLALAPNGDIICGGTGNASVSTNGAASFTPMSALIGAGAGAIQVAADPNYATNNLVYAGSGTAAEGIFRWYVGTSSIWESIRAVAGINIRALVMREQALYGGFDTAGAVPSGAQRTLLSHTPSSIVGLTWLNVLDVGAAAALFNNAPIAMKVAGTGDACSLYAIDTVGVALMAYNDDLALVVPVVEVPAEVFSDPASSRNDQFTVSWGAISNSQGYNGQISSDEGFTQVIAVTVVTGGFVGTVPSNPASPTWVIGAGVLLSGRDYWVRIRVRDQVPGDANWTNWSAPAKFTVIGGEVVTVPYLGPQPLGPVIGAANVPIDGTAMTWAPYARSTKYEMKFCRDAALTDVLATAEVAGTSFQYDGTLDYSTTYFWAVRGIEPAISDWSPTAHFTTAAEPVEPTPPVVIEPPAPAPQIAPGYIWGIIGVGAILVIVVLVLIVRTRRPM